ncbi:choice-of-anchor D domain-containing protein [Luteolibacter luteus]|uniref:Choice-of-anchor D domain-containing protein n=1 Tax=Luteolibacter luteus TaxID=2728835 RepID=A0A858RK04_9BACT|nr:choice-of-anchor D domain-containing protein [Luteolibacter luteus]QJE97055.1 choice-of-anchor D domain-containing protein [Luteolibacter luteus]
MQHPLHRLPLTILLVLGLAMAGLPRADSAPIPHSLEQVFRSQSTARQAGNSLGQSAAMGGNLLAVGSPYDDIGGADSGVVNLYDVTTGTHLYCLANPNPSRESYFGWSIAISGTRVVIGAPQDDTGGNDVGIAYVYDVGAATPTVPLFTFKNPHPGQNDTFGSAVAIDGDLVVVGVPEGDSGQLDTGCAYVFDLGSTTPATPVLRFDNPNSGGDNFGVSVAVSGIRVAIGAAPEDLSGDGCRAYIYETNSSAPLIPVVVLADDTPTTNDQFGMLVDIEGTTVVVSSPQDDTGAQNAGACYVFDIAEGTPAAPIVTIHNPAPALNDHFGSAISLEGSSLVVGSYLDDQGGLDCGRVYLFALSSGTPFIPSLVIDNPTPANNDFYGRSVAIAGPRLVVGAPGDNTGASDAGSAYVHDLNSNTPALPSYSINTPSLSSDEEFGTSVAISGTMVVVGCHHDDRGASNAGCVYVHDFSSDTPHFPVRTLENPTPVLNDYFGGAVAAAGNRIIVAASQDDGGAPNAGTIYVYQRNSGTPTVPVYSIPNPVPQVQDQFGNALAVSGNLLVAGAFKNDVGGMVDAGSAYVFNLASATPSVPILTFDNPEPGLDDWFGCSVAISGTKVAIGAHGNDAGATNSGSVYIYDTSSPTPTTPVAILRDPSPAEGDGFGYTVGISGNYVAVGSPMNESGANDSGSVYIFDLSQSQTVPVLTLDNPAPEPEDYFGISLAMSGTRLVVGASEVDLGAGDTGSAYVYELSYATPALPVAILDNPEKKTGDWFGYSCAIDQMNIVVGAPLEDGATENRGAAFLFDPDPPSPKMEVEQPPGTGLISGAASIHFGDAAVSTNGGIQTVLIRNTGTAALTLTSISLLFGDVGEFSVDAPPLPSVLGIDQTIAFNVAFAPVAAGSRIAIFRILSNAASSSPFDVTLTGQALSAADDTDGDGLNDVVELQLEALGFDWQVNDEELVAILRSGANATGLYSQQQLQDLHPDTPLLSKDPVKGDFVLTLAVKKATDFSNFQLFPVSESQMTINPQGGVDLLVPIQEPKAFFSLQPR